jgi:hypothetical protein
MEPFDILFLIFLVVGLLSRLGSGSANSGHRPGGASPLEGPATGTRHRIGGDPFDEDSSGGLGPSRGLGSGLGLGLGLGLHDDDDWCTNPIYSHLPCNIHHDSLDEGIGHSRIGTGLGSDPFDDGIGSIGGGIGSSTLDDGIGSTSIGTGIGSDPFDD